jgi:hypothetical protein
MSDTAPARSNGAASGARTLARGRSENDRVVKVLGEPTTVTAVTIAPRVSGRFAVRASVIGMGERPGRAMRVTIVRSGRKAPSHTAPPTVVSPAGSTCAVDIELAEGFPLGTEVTLVLMATADGVVTVLPRGATLDVRELP